MTTKKLTFRQKILVAGTLFGMFFGAGNLIFPVPVSYTHLTLPTT